MNPSTPAAPATDSQITLDGLALEADLVLADQVVKAKRASYKSAHATLQDVLDAETAKTAAQKALDAHRSVVAELAAQQETEALQQEARTLFGELEEIRRTLTAQESEALLSVEEAELALHRSRARANEIREEARTLRNTGRHKAARLAVLTGKPSPMSRPKDSSKTGLQALRENEEWERLLAQWRLDDASVPDRMTAYSLTTPSEPHLAEEAHRHRWLASMAQVGQWLEMDPPEN